MSKRALTWSGPGWSLVSERRFLYDGWNLLTEYNTASGFTLAAQHTWGIDLGGGLQDAGGVGGLLKTVNYEQGTVTLLPAYDGNGNVHAMIDRGTGAIRAAFEYSAFGETLRATGDMASNTFFRFSTKYTDQETQLVYYGSRYYNPSLGRFLGRDSIGEKGGLHLYGFCGNNAVNRWDVLGQAFNKNSTSDDYMAVYKNPDLASFMRGQDQFWNWNKPHIYASAGDAIADSMMYSGFKFGAGGDQFMGDPNIWGGTPDTDTRSHVVDGQEYIVTNDTNSTFSNATLVGGQTNGSNWLAATSTAVSPTDVVAPATVATNGALATYSVGQDPVTHEWLAPVPSDGITTANAYVNGLPGLWRVTPHWVLCMYRPG